MSFNINVISLKGNIYSGEAIKILLPSATGEIAVYSKHMPYITPLGTGEVMIKLKDKDLNLTIGKGVFTFINNTATLLIEDEMYAEEISEEKAKEARDKAEELIAKGPQGDELKEALYSLRRSLVDLKVISKRKKRLQ